MKAEEFNLRCAEMKARLARPAAECPRCQSKDTMKKGRSSIGKQMHWCRDCSRHFIGKMKWVPRGTDNGLMCFRCGGYNVFGQGSKNHNGRAGYCRDCRRYFTQGGREDYERYHLLLEMRVKALRLPSDVSAELLQAAVVDVLSGKGYCWTVDLCVTEAFAAARGDYGLGSDHPMYRLQNGQKMHQER